jgi:predicted nucleotidyltransferase
MIDRSTQKVFDFVIKLANEHLHPDEIILFGSRARGNARQTSDYDLAFNFNAGQYQKHWGRFCLDVKENAPTLLSFDLVNLNEVSDEFIKKIREEGITIYQKE